MRNVMNLSQVSPFTYKTKGGARVAPLDNKFTTGVSSKALKECGLSIRRRHTFKEGHGHYVQCISDKGQIMSVNARNLHKV